MELSFNIKKIKFNDVTLIELERTGRICFCGMIQIIVIFYRTKNYLKVKNLYTNFIYIFTTCLEFQLYDSYLNIFDIWNVFLTVSN